ncbi:long-chain fatty acid--CoA ligase [Desulfobaculum bizertense]|uniref:long-chain-fatty-acid--CoA ligase n=1 Tax=Desulfobaculum bizertense TaxID=376490 RepID=UPI001F30CCCC|nr:long-chain fatty acid--CoA ligase [Desulfobaculum bizertense]UIJ39369.1 long-chain fatty acid--CoA ligase [Desulfobaculum bizertense]
MTEITRPWLQSYDKEVSATIDCENIPVFGYLDLAAKKFGKRKAIVFKNWSITYKKLLHKSEVLAANFRNLGIQPGDRVSIMLPNLPQTILSYWGALKAGAIVVMTNPLYMETELIHQLNDAECDTMIVLDHLWPKIEAVRDKLPVKRFIIVRISDCLSFPLNFLYGFNAKKKKLFTDVPYEQKNIIRWKDLLKGKERYSRPPTDPKEDLALLQYTGGTTGISKGVMITHQNMTANVQQCHQILHAIGNKHETFVAVMPYFHIYGLTTCLNLPTSIGATMVPMPRFDPAELLGTLKKRKVSIFPGAPAIYSALLLQKHVSPSDFTSVRYCVSGSAPIPVEILEQFKAITHADIIEGYGLTEASPVTHLNPLVGTKKNGSIGLPFPSTDARIVDMEVGELTLAPGKAGELVLRGPQVMRGYWKRPDETANAVRNGWLYTGDIATMDEEGYFYIVDRKKDLIITSGYNVYPREIDEVLYEHPKIKDAVAVGIPHPARGEIIKVYVVLHSGEKMSGSDVISWCRKKLAKYKVPRKVEFRPELPKTLVGKVLRRALRQEEEEKMKKMAAKRAARKVAKEAKAAKEAQEAEGDK